MRGEDRCRRRLRVAACSILHPVFLSVHVKPGRNLVQRSDETVTQISTRTSVRYCVDSSDFEFPCVVSRESSQVVPCSSVLPSYPSIQKARSRGSRPQAIPHIVVWKQ
ncbi:hypothetical protein BV25DRAFT_709323 [Artomyces pyxidatus]|uniref:Uncharacterized protein n=1 Tax=Artomyces pyxidatus TaxID=48021 RepID=A0ACB8SZE3_9AGAM|nr:hypothetical protein BV25DRAFT_709323 [Artomyces pyxidatus]